VIPIIRPNVRFGEVASDIEAILDSGRLTQGEYVARFEAEVAAKVGVAHGIATTSATTALHLALAAAGVGRGDEVLVSDFSFPATGNVVVQLGAVPVFVDCVPGRFELDLEDLRGKLTDRTRALLPVDPFGQPADLHGLAALARDAGLPLVEDAACALGSSADDRSCGSFPVAGCFSFHPRKVVTTGEGGMVTTDDDELAGRLRLLRNHGGQPGPATGLVFTENGFNYRLGEVAAAIGLAQLRRVDEILADRAATAGRYDAALAGVAGVDRPGPRRGDTWSHQAYVVLLDDAVDRDAVVRRLGEEGIETTLGTYAMHAHPAFARFGYQAGDLPSSLRAQRQSLTLPLVPAMAAADVELVVDGLRRAVEVAGG
jgi:perosamine synthetase